MVSGDPGSRRCFCSVYFYWGFVHSGGLKCSTPKISIARVGQESRTNTKKYQTQKPQKFKSEGQARRIRKASSAKASKAQVVQKPQKLKSEGQAGRIRKASSAKASKAQVGRAGQTNTKKLRVQKPQKLKSDRQAGRIRKSSRYKASNVQAEKAGSKDYVSHKL